MRIISLALKRKRRKLFMNKKQKLTLYVALGIIVASLLVWLAYGAEIFTKYQVMVETQTDLEKQMGISHKEWKDKFIWGLDYTVILSGITILISSVLLFLFRNKKQQEQNKRS